jgi:erythromycin esterase-like protein
MGGFLHDALGDKYFAVGSLVYRGAARAWDTSGEVGVVPQILTPAPPYSVEAVVLGSIDTAFVNLRTANSRFKDWLAIPRYVREFGAVYPGADWEWTLRSVNQAYDAIAVFRTGSPTTPTATGVRVATPAEPPPK